MPLGANRPNLGRSGQLGHVGPAPGVKPAVVRVRRANSESEPTFCGRRWAQKSQFQNETARSVSCPPCARTYGQERQLSVTNGPPLRDSGRLPALSHSRTAERSRVEASPMRCASWKSSLKSGQLRQQMPWSRSMLPQETAPSPGGCNTSAPQKFVSAPRDPASRAARNISSSFSATGRSTARATAVDVRCGPDGGVV